MQQSLDFKPNFRLTGQETYPKYIRLVWNIIMIRRACHYTLS